MISIRYALLICVLLALTEGGRIRRSYLPSWNMWHGMIHPPYQYVPSMQYAYPIIQYMPPSTVTKGVVEQSRNQVTSTTPTTATSTTVTTATTATTTAATTNTPEPTTTTTKTTEQTNNPPTESGINGIERIFSANPVANGSDILQKCTNVRFKSLRDACIRVAQNPILKSMMDVQGYIGEEEKNQPTLLITRGFSFLTPMSGRQTICSEPETCPDYTLDDRPTRRNLLSLSPWVMCREFDPNRFPQWINVAKCLCQGCINYQTGQEDIGDVLSQELTVEINVLKKDILTRTFGQCTRKTCREEVQTVAIGCHCAIAQDIHGN